MLQSMGWQRVRHDCVTEQPQLCYCTITAATYYHCGSEKVTQSSPTLRDPMDYSLPGSSIHEISQARVLEWVATSFSRRSSCLLHCKQMLYRLSRQGSPKCGILPLYHYTVTIATAFTDPKLLLLLYYHYHRHCYYTTTTPILALLSY